MRIPHLIVVLVIMSNTCTCYSNYNRKHECTYSLGNKASFGRFNLFACFTFAAVDRSTALGR